MIDAVPTCQPSLASVPSPPCRTSRPHPIPGAQDHFRFLPGFLPPRAELERARAARHRRPQSTASARTSLDSSRPELPHHPLHLPRPSPELFPGRVGRNPNPTVGRHWSQPELRLPRVNPLLRPSSAQIDPKNGFVVSHSSSPSSFPSPSSAAAGGTPPLAPWPPLLLPPHAAGRARAAQSRAAARADAPRPRWSLLRTAAPPPGLALAGTAVPPPRHPCPRAAVVALPCRRRPRASWAAPARASAQPRLPCPLRVGPPAPPRWPAGPSRRRARSAHRRRAWTGKRQSRAGESAPPPLSLCFYGVWGPRVRILG